MPSGDLTAQNAAITIVPPKDKIGLISIGMGAGSHASAALALEVEHYPDNWETILMTRVDTDARVSSIGVSEAAWEVAGAWPRVRARRTDANGSSCLAYLEVR